MAVRKVFYDSINDNLLMPLVRDFISFCDSNGLANAPVEEAGKFFLPSAPHMKQIDQYIKLMSAATAVEYDVAQAAAFASAQHNLGDQNLVVANAKTAGIGHYPVKDGAAPGYYTSNYRGGRGRGWNRGGRGGNKNNNNNAGGAKNEGTK